MSRVEPFDDDATWSRRAFTSADAPSHHPSNPPVVKKSGSTRAVSHAPSLAETRSEQLNCQGLVWIDPRPRELTVGELNQTLSDDALGPMQSC
jgi:hypothetical protein